MNELLLEVWGVEALQSWVHPRHQVELKYQMIMLWVECFSTLVAVLVTKCQKTYLTCISRVVYDQC